jgi:excisionase family DNA binding protein
MNLAIASPPRVAGLPVPSDRLLGVDQAASYTGLSVRYLAKLRIVGGGCAYHKIGVRVLYRLSDLDAWLANKRRTSTADNGKQGGGE